MRTTLIALAAGRLFSAPAYRGNVPASGVAAYSEPYVVQPAGPAYVAGEAYVQYAPVPQYVAIPAQVPMGSALPTPVNAAMVVLLGLGIGVAAAKYSASVAALAVGGEEDLEAGAAEESDDDMPTPGRLVEEEEEAYVSTAMKNEIEHAGLEMPKFYDASKHYYDMNRTQHPGHEAIMKRNKTWYHVDAEGMRLGRMASEIARRLLGKHKEIYYPGADTGDFVIVTNCEKVIVTGKKYDWKFYRRHSGRPGGMKIETFKELQARIPERIIEKAVWGMLPKNAYGRELFRHLKVYKGPTHPHGAQKPVELEWMYKAKAQEPDKRKMAFLSVLGSIAPVDVATLVMTGNAHDDSRATAEFSLVNIGPKKTSWHRRKRKGRGIAAGQGKTCGFGNGGAKSRAGNGKVRLIADGSKFAGGSNLYYRMGSRKDHHRPHGPGHTYTKYSLIQLKDLNSLPDGSEVSFDELIQRGLITKNSKRPLKKVLGGTEFTVKNLTIKAHAFSKTAQTAIEEAGGKVVVLTKHNKEIAEEKVVAALAVHGWGIREERVVAKKGVCARAPPPSMNQLGRFWNGWGIRSERVTPKTTNRRKRQLRIRKKLSGTKEAPRLSVHRSNNHMYASVINDDEKPNIILCGASTMSPELKEKMEEIGSCKNKDAAYAVGELVGKRAKALGVEKLVFDRSGYKYHGRVAAVADGARSVGLEF
jgi:large subunit ribosomal protein L13